MISVLAGILLFFGCATQPADIPITTDGITSSDIDTQTEAEITVPDTEIQTETEATTESDTVEETTRPPKKYVFSNKTLKAVDPESRYCYTMGRIPQETFPVCPEDHVKSAVSLDFSNRTKESDMEVKYDNLVVTLGWTEYKKNSLIEIHVDNLNGKYLLAYDIPYIERYDEESGEWIRLSYCPDDYYYLIAPKGWRIWKDDEVIYSINPYYIYEQPVQAGKYRFILFIGPKVLYSPEFNIVDG